MPMSTCWRLNWITLLQDGAVAVPDAISQMGQAARSVFIDFVVVTQVVDDPQNGPDCDEGYEDAQPHLKSYNLVWMKWETFDKMA